MTDVWLRQLVSVPTENGPVTGRVERIDPQAQGTVRVRTVHGPCIVADRANLTALEMPAHREPTT